MMTIILDIELCFLISIKVKEETILCFHTSITHLWQIWTTAPSILVEASYRLVHQLSNIYCRSRCTFQLFPLPVWRLSCTWSLCKGLAWFLSLSDSCVHASNGHCRLTILETPLDSMFPDHQGVQSSLSSSCSRKLPSYFLSKQHTVLKDTWKYRKPAQASL